MPRITTCLFDGKPTTIAEALELRDGAQKRKAAPPLFRCDECTHPVKPHKDGTTGAKAHFEHIEEQPQCPYMQD